MLEVHPGADGLVRVVSILCADGRREISTEVGATTLLHARVARATSSEHVISIGEVE